MNDRPRGRWMRAALAAGCLFVVGCSPNGGAGQGSIGVWSGASQPVAFAPSLGPLFDQLAQLESGQRDRPVVIVQIGDSHTAGDRFSGRLRQRFQDRFGAAGRGVLPPGVPFDYYEPTLVTMEQTVDWDLANSFSSSATGLFAVTGLRNSTDEPDQVVAVESVEPDGFDQVAIGMVLQPGGGSFAVTVDGRTLRTVSTDSPELRAARQDVSVPEGGRRLELRTVGDGPVSLLSLAIQRGRPGVVYDSHGIVGASVGILGAWEPATVAWELADREPALVVLAFGTNEGFHDDLEPAEYRADFAAQLAFLERAAPDAAILVIGPPDADRLPPRCRDEQDEPDAVACRPLSAAEATVYEALVVDRNDDTLCRWHPPPNLSVVREIQRTITQQRGHYFWDWSDVMGGECGTHEWALREPPLAFHDRVHLRREGYRISADTLFDDLMAMYASYRSTAGLPSDPSR